MSLCLCSTCDLIFDPEVHDLARFEPEFVCGACVQDEIDQLEKERKAFKRKPMMGWSRSYAS